MAWGSCWVVLNLYQLICISYYLLTMTRNEGRFEVQILATVLLILLLSAVADHHVVVASAPNVAASLDSGKNSGSAGLGSITYSSTRVTKAVPVVATKGTTGGQPAPWRPPVVNLQYFGGPVMWKPIRVHFIWYVTWHYLFLVTDQDIISCSLLHGHCKVDEELLHESSCYDHFHCFNVYNLLVIGVTKSPVLQMDSFWGFQQIFQSLQKITSQICSDSGATMS